MSGVLNIGENFYHRILVALPNDSALALLQVTISDRYGGVRAIPRGQRVANAFATLSVADFI